MKKIKGSVAVFMSIVFVTIASAVLVIADVFQVMSAVSVGANNMALAAFSADNLYNKEIFEDMDLLLYTMSDSELVDILEDIVVGNEYSNKKRELILSHTFTFESSYLTEDPFWNFFFQMNSYTQEYVNFDKSLGKKLSTKPGKAEETTKAYTILVYDSEKLAEELKTELKGNLYDALFERTGDGGTINSSKYSSRFFLDIMKWCEGTERVAEDFDKAENKDPLPDELRQVALYGRDTENQETGFIWFNNADKTSYFDDYFTYRLESTIAYIIDHYSSYLDNKVTKSGLKGEIEYIIYGYASDRENIAKVSYEILQQRIYANYNSILKAGAKLDSEVENAANLRWAINEAYHDLQVLLHGGKVKWSKSIDEFFTGKEENIQEAWDRVDKLKKYKGSEEGDGYMDYLINQIYLSCYSGQIVCLETVYAHQLDLLQYAYGVDVYQCKYSSEIRDNICINEYSLVSAFSTVGKIVMTNYSKELTYRIGD